MNLFRPFSVRSVRMLTLIGIGLWTLSACNAEKELTQTPKQQSMSVETPEFYLKHRLLYQTFSGRGDVRLVMDDQKQKLSFKVDMNREQDLLASVRAMGLLEVSRAYATPDSIYALNRLNKTAYALNYQEGVRLLQADIPFDALQSLFVGSPLLPVDAPVIDVEVQKDSAIVIVQRKDNFIQTAQYNLANQSLEHLTLKATDRPFQCTIVYTNYQKVGIGQSMAYDRQIEINNKGKEIAISLNFLQAGINQPVNTNFTIPNSYAVKRDIQKEEGQ